jgi:hypothetical protein
LLVPARQVGQVLRPHAHRLRRPWRRGVVQIDLNEARLREERGRLRCRNGLFVERDFQEFVRHPLERMRHLRDVIRILPGREPRRHVARVDGQRRADAVGAHLHAQAAEAFGVGEGRRRKREK